MHVDAVRRESETPGGRQSSSGPSGLANNKKSGGSHVESRMAEHDWVNTGIRRRPKWRKEPVHTLYVCKSCGATLDMTDMDGLLVKRDWNHVHAVAKEKLDGEFLDCDLATVSDVMRR